MAVVPLRVGAGVKGKVVEAAYFQIPLVTTTIGAEGLDAGMGNMVVEAIRPNSTVTIAGRRTEKNLSKNVRIKLLFSGWDIYPDKKKKAAIWN